MNPFKQWGYWHCAQYVNLSTFLAMYISVQNIIYKTNIELYMISFVEQFILNKYCVAELPFHAVTANDWAYKANFQF